jgi:hypothetical protein
MGGRVLTICLVENRKKWKALVTAVMNSTRI